MNTQLARLFGVVVLLFAVLIAATSYTTVFGAEGLDSNSKNRRDLIRTARIPRGLVLADDGTVLARNRPRGTRDNRWFSRVYPQGPLFSHAVGYSFIQFGQTGLEKSRNDDLIGKEDEFESILTQLESRSREGNDVVTNLDPKAQRVARASLAGQRGSIVALEPKTGKVRVMVSQPDYDPNQVPRALRRLNRDRQARPLLNRATQELYPPGSTFKVVTAAAALDTGKFTPDSVLDGSSPRIISGVPLSNFGGEDFGPISLTDALTHSVNTVWAQVGERIGPHTLERYMNRFGFNQDPELDYPDGEMASSGVIGDHGQLLGPNAGFDVGRVAIGQGGAEGAIRVTPLQMAEVAGAIGNGGVLVKPRLTERVVRKDGRVKERIEPDTQARVMSRGSARRLGEMMSHVVEEGTGTAAALSGVRVAGKTGTAEILGGRANQAWFIAFAPVEDPKVAIAVTLGPTQGEGGTVAAPIAKRVLEALLGGGGG